MADLAVSHTLSPYLTTYPFTESSGYGTKYANPSTLPGSSGRSAAFSPDNLDLVDCTQSSPYLSTYPFVSGVGYGTKYADPGTLPGSAAYGCSFSSTGGTVFVVFNNSPFIAAYPFTSGTGYGTKYADPTTLPTLATTSVQTNHSNTEVAIGHVGSPYVRVYPWSSGFGTQYANPSSLTGGTGRKVEFSPNDDVLAVSGEGSLIKVYEWTNGVGFGSAYTSPATLPAGQAWGATFSHAGDALLTANNSSPYVTGYPWSYAGGYGTQYSDPATLPTGGGRGVSFSPTGVDVSVAHLVSPYVTSWPFDSTTGYGTKYTDPGTLPTGGGGGLDFSNPTASDTTVDQTQTGVARISKPAITFMESGSAATQAFDFYTSNSVVGSGAITSDAQSILGSSRSIKLHVANSTADSVRLFKNGVISDAGSRVTFGFRFSAVPNAPLDFFAAAQYSGDGAYVLAITAAGKIAIYDKNYSLVATGATTLSINTDYRISVAHIITSTSVNNIAVFLDGVSEVTATNLTAVTTAISLTFSSGIYLKTSTNAVDFYISHIYVDDGQSLTDVGDKRITFKRPNANGTTNEFTTQIGASGSGYGTGHSPQVNENPSSNTNGWSEASGASVSKNEYYNIEGVATGDKDLSSATILASGAWAKVNGYITYTGSIYLNGVASDLLWSVDVEIRTSAFVIGSTYPAGTGADVGVKSPIQAAPNYNLYECGVIVAYTPATVIIKNQTGVARIQKAVDRTQSGVANILKPLVRFLESGSSATYGLEMYDSITAVSGATITSDTQSVLGSTRSIKLHVANSTTDFASLVKNSVAYDSGARISFGFRISAIPNAPIDFFAIELSGVRCFVLGINASGNIAIYNNALTLVATGSTVLSVDTDYRISLAYTITSSSVNNLTVFLNGVSEVSATNMTVNTGSTNIAFSLGNHFDTSTNAIDIYIAHVYTDNAGIGDPGNVRVTAKRPVANGFFNDFTTQIGSGGSGYGSGHSPQVNERPLSTANGWSFVYSSTAGIEGFTIEAANVGDVDLTGANIINSASWISLSSTVSTGAYLVDTSNYTLLSVLTGTPTVYMEVLGSPTYPSGNRATGVYVTGTAGTFNLFECGVLIAYIPVASPSVDKTQTGKARIRKTTDQTTTGKGRVQKTVDVTQTGNGRIQKNVDSTQTGVSRITKTVDVTQAGISSIRKTVDQAQTGVANISVNSTVDATQTGKSSIRKTVDTTQTGKANIAITQVQTQTGVSSVRKTVDVTQTGVASIAVENTGIKTQLGTASIRKTVDRDQTGVSRLQRLIDVTTTGKARIQKVLDRVQTGISRISGAVLRTQTGKSRITALVDTVQTGISRLQKLVDTTQAGTGRVQKEIDATQTGVAKIYNPVDRDQTGVANIIKIHVYPYTRKATSPYSRKNTPYTRF